MKRVFILLCLATCVLTSCDKHNNSDLSNDGSETEVVKNSEIIVKESSEGYSAVNNQAINGIQPDIIETGNSTFNQYYKDSHRAHRTAIVAIFLSLTSLIFAIVFFIIYLKRYREEHNKSIIDSKNLDKRVLDIFDRLISPSYNNRPSNSVSEEYISSVIKKYMKSQAFEIVLKKMLSDYDSSEKTYTRPSPAVPKPSSILVPASNHIPEAHNIIELYAKDSMNNVLTGVTAFYQQGKSIYKLLLNSQDSTTAELTICLDREEVKERIFRSSDDLLEPVCVVQRKRNNPEELSMISIKGGKAERLSSDAWEVTESIIVELS